jgi:Ca2+-binding RTX toxin-like protein
MSRILIEGTPVALSSGSSSGDSGSGGISVSGHLLLVYEDNAGNEFVVRGGPQREGNPDYGALIIEQNIPINSSIDRRGDATPASRGSRDISLNGRNAEDVWNLILQHAKNINDRSFSYSPTGKNSNGTVGNLLDLVGIDVDDVLPDPDGIMLFSFSGKKEKFEFDYTINGTDSNDKIVGRRGNQTFSAGQGNDEIEGGKGNDEIGGGEGNDEILGGKGNDTIDGGEGTDKSIYKGVWSDYDIEFLPDNTVRISDKVGDRDGSDILKNVDIAVFSDKSIDLVPGQDIRPGQDIAFVIDTTASMSDDIAAVKARASDIINAIFEDDRGFLNSRIAVVGYKDPVTNTFLSFTNQPKIDDRKTAALNAINSISVSGGGDFPEAVNAGLIRALSGGAGEWREEAISRRIILFGDAPPKDTDLRAQVLELASDVKVSGDLMPLSIAGDIETSRLASGLAVTRFTLTAADADSNPIAIPVEIFTILIGNDPKTRADFESLAAATGGKAFSAADASEVVNTLIVAIKAPEGRNDVPIAVDDRKNDAPIAVDDRGFTANTIIPKTIAVTTLLANDTDVNAGDVLQLTGVDRAIGGSVSLEGETVVFEVNDDFSGTASFDYAISDGNGGSDVATVSIEVGKTFKGGNCQDTLTGTEFGDVLLGGYSKDLLNGGDGDDYIDGGLGKDTLIGGSGNDVFVLANHAGSKTITDFKEGLDLIGLSDGLNLGQLTISNRNGDTFITQGRRKVLAILQGIDSGVLAAEDFIDVSDRDCSPLERFLCNSFPSHIGSPLYSGFNGI